MHGLPILDKEKGNRSISSDIHSFQNALIGAGEINEDDKNAAFEDWKTDIQSVTLKEWRVKSKKRLERRKDRQRTQNSMQKSLTQKTALETENWSVDTAVPKKRDVRDEQRKM
jgi:hypothetical protein